MFAINDSRWSLLFIAIYFIGNWWDTYEGRESKEQGFFATRKLVNSLRAVSTSLIVSVAALEIWWLFDRCYMVAF